MMELSRKHKYKTATAQIPHVTEEEENYLRMQLLVTRISKSAVRVFFDKEFDPSCLYDSLKKGFSELKVLKKNGVINNKQWKLLFPGGGSKSIKDTSTLNPVDI